MTNFSYSKSKYILVHDIGTTGNKTCLFNENCELVSMDYIPYKTYYPRPGYAEQNPHDWWEAICSSTKRVLELAKISKKDIASISFSGTMMGCIPIDKEGNLLRESVPIYADDRASKQAGYIARKIGGDKIIYNLTGTGQAPNSYSISKFLWIKENEPMIYNKTYKFLNTKDYIIGKLTGNFNNTDYSDASDMGLLDINKREWSKKILGVAGIDEELLPEIQESTKVIGVITQKAAEEIGLLPGTPVVMGGGDVLCTATGAGVIKEGIGFIYLGSGNWFGTYAEKTKLDLKTRIVNMCHLIPNKYLLMNIMINGGICYQWIRDNIFDFEKDLAKRIDIDPFRILDLKAESVKQNSNNLIFLPYMRGMWAGTYNPYARGAFIGLSLEHGKSHIARAVLEGVAFSIRQLIEIAENQGIQVNDIRIVGGGAKSRLWRQIIADVCGKTISYPLLTQEAGSLGAVIAAGVGIGLYKDFSVANDLVKIKDRIYPQEKNHKIYNEIYPVFKESYQLLIPVFKKLRFITNSVKL